MDWPAAIRVGNERTSERITKLGNCRSDIGNCSSSNRMASPAKRKTSPAEEFSLDPWYRIERKYRVFGAMHLARGALHSRSIGIGDPYSTDIWSLWGHTSREITRFVHARPGRLLLSRVNGKLRHAGGSVALLQESHRDRIRLAATVVANGFMRVWLRPESVASGAEAPLFRATDLRVGFARFLEHLQRLQLARNEAE
jgi:hypothetical protein